jgi:hypothetical protein
MFSHESAYHSANCMRLGVLPLGVVMAHLLLVCAVAMRGRIEVTALEAAIKQ